MTTSPVLDLGFAAYTAEKSARIRPAERNKALVLNLFAQQQATGELHHPDHEANDIDAGRFCDAVDGLVRDGFAALPDGVKGIAVITPAGLAAHAAAQNAVAEIARKIAEVRG